MTNTLEIVPALIVADSPFIDKKASPIIGKNVKFKPTPKPIAKPFFFFSGMVQKRPPFPGFPRQIQRKKFFSTYLFSLGRWTVMLSTFCILIKYLYRLLVI